MLNYFEQVVCKNHWRCRVHNYAGHIHTHTHTHTRARARARARPRKSVLWIYTSHILRETHLITARVRSTREGNVLTRVCPSICLSTGGGSGPAGRGGGQVQPAGGQVSPAGGGSGPASRGGGSGPASRGVGGSGPAGAGGSGPASRAGGQVQLVGGSGPAGRGGQVQPGGGQVQLAGGGGSAKIWQQKELLLRGGRYASCVHAGGHLMFLYLSNGQNLKTCIFGYFKMCPQQR